jgi:hypothetical protein
MLPVDDAHRSHSLANATIAELNSFVRTHEAALEALNISTNIWVILDEQSLQTSTCVLAEQVYDEDEEELSAECRALRLPCSEAWICFANLDIANMEFEEYADVDAGVQEDGTFQWVGPFEPSNKALEESSTEQEGRRQAALNAARDLGHID